MNETKRAKMYAEIKRHGEQINRVFNTNIEPVQLAKKLHSLEIKAHRLTTDYCNGVIDGEAYEAAEIKILNRLDKTLNFRALGVPVFVNGDARGYALKIKTSWINDQYRKDNAFRLCTDMGGYGIIAPDFTPAAEYNK